MRLLLQSLLSPNIAVLRSANRRTALIETIDDVWRGKMRVTGAASGAHVVLWPGGDIEEAKAIASAAESDVGVYGISGYFIQNKRPGLLLGYAQLNVADFQQGIAISRRRSHRADFYHTDRAPS